MKEENIQTIGQLVADNYRAAEVFQSFGLDFCCGGNKTIEEACTDTGVDYREVQQALQQLEKKQDEEQQNYNQWSLDFLIDYIINNHHRFSRTKLPEIRAYMKKVAMVHGERHPELKQMHHEFTHLHGDMLDHMDNEEGILFPYIKQLVKVKEEGRKLEMPNFGEASDPIAIMEQEHDEAGTTMKRIRELSNGFRPPEDACTTYRLLYENLEAFERDLHKHVHLENNILFPKALHLERFLISN